MSAVAVVENQIIKRVIKDALAAGYDLTVFDGEEFTLEHSRDAKAVFAALKTTDDDSLRFSKYGSAVGFVHFVYGNDGFDVISDYSDNAKTEAILAGAIALADKLELEA